VSRQTPQCSGTWSQFREGVRRRRWAWLLVGLLALVVVIAATPPIRQRWRTRDGHDLPVLESHRPHVGDGALYLRDASETVRCGLWPPFGDCPTASLFEAHLVDCALVRDRQAEFIEQWSADGFREITQPYGGVVWRLATDDVSTGEVWAYLEVTQGNSGFPSVDSKVTAEQIAQGCSIIVRLSVEDA